MLDFDGTLSEIVARPEHARPVDGAREALIELAGRFRTVAIVTGRRSEEVAALLDAPHVTYVGLYGLEDGANELVTAGSRMRTRFSPFWRSAAVEKL